MYQAVLHELNRSSTISMTPTRFNYHAKVGQLEYLKMRYWAFDKHQKAVDDLQPIIVVTDGIAGSPSPIANTGANTVGSESFAVPKDIAGLDQELFLLQVHFLLTYQGNPCHDDGAVSEPIVARYRTHNVDRRNAYQRGNDDKLFYLFHGNRLRRAEKGKSLSVATSCIMSYLRYPREITVDADGASLTDPELGTSQNMDIVKWVAASYLETIESLRQRTIAEVQGRTFVHQTALG